MYKSAPTACNNVGISYISQEAADTQAELMDKVGCINCINCNNCINSNNCNYCNNCINCNNCNYCYYCYDCYDCYDCYNCYDCYDCASQPVFQLSGLRWKIYATDTELIIGCQRHTFERWKEFDDRAIARMDPEALEFWRAHKTTIFSLIEATRKKDSAS